MGFILQTAVCKKPCNWKVSLKSIKEKDLRSTQYILITLLLPWERIYIKAIKVLTGSHWHELVN